MVRLDDILAKVDPIITGLVSSTSTTVAVYTRNVENDPDTLTVTPTSETTGTPQELVLSMVPPTELHLAPGIDLMLGDWKMTATDDFDPAPGTLLKIITSLDARLVGKVGKVLGSRVSGAGILTTVYVRPERP